jgi:hypothetical protein
MHMYTASTVIFATILKLLPAFTDFLEAEYFQLLAIF